VVFGIIAKSQFGCHMVYRVRGRKSKTKDDIALTSVRNDIEACLQK
jgi:hypothetical protein